MLLTSSIWKQNIGIQNKYALSLWYFRSNWMQSNTTQRDLTYPRIRLTVYRGLLFFMSPSLDFTENAS